MKNNQAFFRGQKVSFKHNGQRWCGVITRLNPVRAKISASKEQVIGSGGSSFTVGTSWRVSYSQIEDNTDNKFVLPIVSKLTEEKEIEGLLASLSKRMVMANEKLQSIRNKTFPISFA